MTIRLSAYLILFFSVATSLWMTSAPGLSLSCTGNCSSEEDLQIRREVYRTLSYWCQQHLLQEESYPKTYDATREAMKKFRKGQLLSAEEQNGLLLRRLIRQHPGLKRRVVDSILEDPRINTNTIPSLSEFISVFGMLAGTRVGFVSYEPKAPWSSLEEASKDLFHLKVTDENITEQNGDQ
ncbi:MAG: hypothetical protein H6618_01440 [Deltaproteobacteria bacterium]|nr:hypothetical protein [Deltaproteobacteria bacterium]